MNKIVLLALLVTTVGFIWLVQPTAPAVSASCMPAPTPADRPLYAGYKGVTIGLRMDDARTKLGTPKDASDEQDFFEFSARESAQVYYDVATHTVRALTIMYASPLEGAPGPKDVFGQDAEAKPDGGIFKKVDYPKAGYWVSYTKTAGDEPMIIIALQKM